MDLLYKDDFSFGRVVEGEYVKCGSTLDDLPYTPEFESLYTAVSKKFPSKSRCDVIHHLHNARKAKELPATGIRGSPGPALSDGAKTILLAVVERAIGSIGARDQLPYTEVFELVAVQFKSKANVELPPHDLWRAISNLSKRSEDQRAGH